MYILSLIGVVLFADKSRNQVRLFLLSLLHDLEEAGSLSWGNAVLAYLYRKLCRATSPDSSGIVDPLILLQVMFNFLFLYKNKEKTLYLTFIFADMGMRTHPRWSSGEIYGVAPPSGFRCQPHPRLRGTQVGGTSFTIREPFACPDFLQVRAR